MKAILAKEEAVPDPGRVTSTITRFCITDEYTAAATQKAIVFALMGCNVPAGATLKVAVSYADGGGNWSWGNGRYAIATNAGTAGQWFTVTNWAKVDLVAGKTYQFSTEADHGATGEDSTQCSCHTLVQIVEL